MGAPKGSKNALGHDGSNAGRPRKVVDEAAILDLASIMCTNEEICHMLDICEDTLINNFSSSLKQGRSIGKMSVRRQQYELLKQGNATMGVWLGKVYCGQKEEQHIITTTMPAADIPLAAQGMIKEQK